VTWPGFRMCEDDDFMVALTDRLLFKVLVRVEVVAARDKWLDNFVLKPMRRDERKAACFAANNPALFELIYCA
jgi:hypothetical protein